MGDELGDKLVDTGVLTLSDDLCHPLHWREYATRRWVVKQICPEDRWDSGNAFIWAAAPGHRREAEKPHGARRRHPGRAS